MADATRMNSWLWAQHDKTAFLGLFLQHNADFIGVSTNVPTVVANNGGLLGL